MPQPYAFTQAERVLSAVVPGGAVIKVAGFSRGLDACPGVCIVVFCSQFICRQSCLLSGFLMPPVMFKCVCVVPASESKNKIPHFP